MGKKVITVSITYYTNIGRKYMEESFLHSMYSMTLALKLQQKGDICQHARLVSLTSKHWIHKWKEEITFMFYLHINKNSMN